jgi:hypothetical protein
MQEKQKQAKTYDCFLNTAKMEPALKENVSDLDAMHRIPM